MDFQLTIWAFPFYLLSSYVFSQTCVFSRIFVKVRKNMEVTVTSNDRQYMWLDMAIGHLARVRGTLFILLCGSQFLGITVTFLKEICSSLFLWKLARSYSTSRTLKCFNACYIWKYPKLFLYLRYAINKKQLLIVPTQTAGTVVGPTWKNVHLTVSSWT